MATIEMSWFAAHTEDPLTLESSNKYQIYKSQRYALVFLNNTPLRIDIELSRVVKRGFISKSIGFTCIAPSGSNTRSQLTTHSHPQRQEFPPKMLIPRGDNHGCIYL
jgi:hypothetical protein